MGDDLSVLFDDPEFRTTSFAGAASPENLFSILDTFEDTAFEELSIPFLSFVDDESVVFSSNELGKVGAKRRSLETDEEEEEEEEDGEANLARKKLKFSGVAVAEASGVSSSGEQKVSHITVERNRRKQMNEHLGVLRSLMPCFYVKRGDQASIIGGVVDYIKELQQVLQSLEAKKQRKTYSEVLSPKPPASSPRSLPPLSPRVLPPLSPRPSPLSPRVGLPISPQTPQSGSPYKPTRNSNLQQSYPINDSSPSLETTSTLSQELSVAGAAANSRSAAAEVEVKFSGPHVLLSTVSAWNPGQIVKIISALEGHSLEILQVDINTVDDTMLNSFTIKIGIECELSAEELAQEIQQTFS